MTFVSLPLPDPSARNECSLGISGQQQSLVVPTPPFLSCSHSMPVPMAPTQHDPCCVRSRPPRPLERRIPGGGGEDTLLSTSTPQALCFCPQSYKPFKLLTLKLLLRAQPSPRSQARRRLISSLFLCSPLNPHPQPNIFSPSACRGVSRILESTGGSVIYLPRVWTQSQQFLNTVLHPYSDAVRST